MHETVISKRIIEEAKKHGKVKAITVEVGDLAHVPAEEMERTLTAMVDWKVNIRKKQAKISCVCGYEGRPVITEKGHDLNVFHCPECKAPMPQILDGNDMVLVDVEVE